MKSTSFKSRTGHGLVVDKAKTEFKAFQKLYEKADHEWQIASRSGRQLLNAVKFYEVAIPLSYKWLQRYKPYIEDLSPELYGIANEMFEWLLPLEQIMKFWLPQYHSLIKSQQIEHYLPEATDQIIAEINDLLESHIYLPKAEILCLNLPDLKKLR